MGKNDKCMKRWNFTWFQKSKANKKLYFRNKTSFL